MPFRARIALNINCGNKMFWVKTLSENLRNTVLHILGVNLARRAGDEHYTVRRFGSSVQSQLTLETNDMG